MNIAIENKKYKFSQKDKDAINFEIENEFNKKFNNDYQFKELKSNIEILSKNNINDSQIADSENAYKFFKNELKNEISKQILNKWKNNKQPEVFLIPFKGKISLKISDNFLDIITNYRNFCSYIKKSENGVICFESLKDFICELENIKIQLQREYYLLNESNQVIVDNNEIRLEDLLDTIEILKEIAKKAFDTNNSLIYWV